jgi:hypothetical protein
MTLDVLDLLAVIAPLLRDCALLLRLVLPQSAPREVSLEARVSCGGLRVVMLYAARPSPAPPTRRAGQPRARGTCSPKARNQNRH